MKLSLTWLLLAALLFFSACSTKNQPRKKSSFSSADQEPTGGEGSVTGEGAVSTSGSTGETTGTDDLTTVTGGEGSGTTGGNGSSTTTGADDDSGGDEDSDTTTGSEARIIGEYGIVQIDDIMENQGTDADPVYVRNPELKTTVVLNNAFIDPVVIVSDPTNEGADKVAVRVSDVDGQSFRIWLQETSDHGSGIHNPEYITFLVVEAGNWELSTGVKFSAGNLNGIDHNSNTTQNTRRIGYEVDYGLEIPKVFTQVITDNDIEWVHARTGAMPATNLSFELDLSIEEGDTNGHAAEDVSWLAILESKVNMNTDPNGQVIEVGGSNGITNDFKKIDLAGHIAGDQYGLIAKAVTYYDNGGSLRINNWFDDFGTSFDVKIQEFDPSDSIVEVAYFTLSSVNGESLSETHGILTGKPIE